MYRVGQSVVHPMHGAGIIEGETNEILEGTARTYYVFRSPVSGLTLKLPADNCTAIGIRAPETPERVREIVADIPSLAVEEDRNWSRRDARRGLSTGERRMLHSAKQILLSEIALVQEMAYDAAERWIDAVVMTGARTDGETV